MCFSLFIAFFILGIYSNFVVSISVFTLLHYSFLKVGFYSSAVILLC